MNDLKYWDKVEVCETEKAHNNNDYDNNDWLWFYYVAESKYWWHIVEIENGVENYPFCRKMEYLDISIIKYKIWDKIVVEYDWINYMVLNKITKKYNIRCWDYFLYNNYNEKDIRLATQDEIEIFFNK